MLELSPKVLDCEVPTLILQPLVENAIRYGMVETGNHLVRVEAKRIGQRLRLSVGNPKMNGEVASKQSSGFGIGLENTRERLVQHYGEQFGFEVSEEGEAGYLVRLEIPSALAQKSAGAEDEKA